MAKRSNGVFYWIFCDKLLQEFHQGNSHSSQSHWTCHMQYGKNWISFFYQTLHQSFHLSFATLDPCSCLLIVFLIYVDWICLIGGIEDEHQDLWAGKFNYANKRFWCFLCLLQLVPLLHLPHWLIDYIGLT